MVDFNDTRLNRAPESFNPNTDFPEGFWNFFLPLHKEFTPRQQSLLRKRQDRINQAQEGTLPNHLEAGEAVKGDWNIKLPDFIKDQRNQMTGPADDTDLVVKMVNSGAPGVMIDLEDSMANQWPCLLRGYENVRQALTGELSYYDKKRDRTVHINPDNTAALLTRARGLHLNQAGLIKGELISASLLDVAMVAYQADADKLKHPLCFYIPKSESSEEALWWNEVFKAVEKSKGWEANYIKCMALVESHSLAHEIEEFVYNLKDHLVGINLGRWDYMASLIHYNLRDADWVLPDRNTIPHDVAFFQNLRLLIPEICHKRGILAIGGMTALFPSRQDAELNDRALKNLEVDKKNEASFYFDGAWTGHPDQNQIAVDQFPFPNQLNKRPENLDRYGSLRPSVKGIGKTTVAGTRAAARTVIRYRQGYITGKGASLLDGYMEDLATDRIYRLMIAQRHLHRDSIVVLDEQGQDAKHNKEFISQLFNEELEKVLEDAGELTDEQKQSFIDAKNISENMIFSGEFDPV